MEQDQTFKALIADALRVANGADVVADGGEPGFGMFRTLAENLRLAVAASARGVLSDGELDAITRRANR